MSKDLSEDTTKSNLDAMINKPKAVSSSKKGRLGSKTAPIESNIDVDLIEYEDESFQEYINSYNYYIYYHSIKPKDPRLPKPLYKPAPDLEFIKCGLENVLGGSEFSSTKDDEGELLSQAMNQQMKVTSEVKEEKDNKQYESAEKGLIDKEKYKPLFEKIEKSPTTYNNFSGSVYNYFKEGIPQGSTVINPMNMNPEMYLNYGMNYYNVPQNYQQTVSPSSNMSNPHNINMNKHTYQGYPQISPNHSAMNSGFSPSYNQNYKQTTPKNSKNLPTPDLNELLYNILDYCKDHSGSRIVQRKFEEGTDEEKDRIVEVLLPNIYSLTKDVFGNYVIQKIFELSANSQRKKFIMNEFKDKLYELSLHMYGCRVIQKALEVIDLDEVKMIFSEIKHAIPKFIEDQNGNHVIQKLIERLQRSDNISILKSFRMRTYEFATHQYGCRVLQKIFEFCQKEDYQDIIEDLLCRVLDLTQDQYGNYIIQHIIEKQNFNNSYSELIWKDLKGRVFDLSIHKYASNVIEKLLAYGGQKIRKEIIEEIITKDDQFNDTLLAMVRDKYGNYVVQKLIEVADSKMKENMVKRIVSSQAMKKRDGFCKNTFK